MIPFKLITSLQPAGDQPNAIKNLCNGLNKGKLDQILLGATGSGKTFTMANIIAATDRPALIVAHNKILAAQLYEEMKMFFPFNAVEFFISYYDYYQPEAYIPQTDTFIEKDAAINEHIEQLRHSATKSLLSRKDVIVVSSVSCIYGLGSPETYLNMSVKLDKNMNLSLEDLMEKLINIQYKRTKGTLQRGNFIITGDVLNIFPSHYENTAWRISYFDDTIEYIHEFLPLTGEIIMEVQSIEIFANNHYVTPRPTIMQAIEKIKEELKDRILYFRNHNLPIQEQRIKERVSYDLELMAETGFCKGIEHYTRYLCGIQAGHAPPTLLDYLPQEAILFIDESHVTIPQISAMYKGNLTRKNNLIEHGFRLPSAHDNRPLKFTEWEERRPQTIYVSATPGKYEKNIIKNDQPIEQIIRPTGLTDPVCIVKPAINQIDDLMHEINATAKRGFRTMVTALTKKNAEHLSEYLRETGIKAIYMHSDIGTLDRVEIISDLRKGVHDVLIGVNLLREGLDIPECGLVAILDADKEGFLRSDTSLIQTIGRAARNVEGRVILYADHETKSMHRALDETERRRIKQINHNKKHNITPQNIIKQIHKSLKNTVEKNSKASKKEQNNIQQNNQITILQAKMLAAAKELNFEEAIRIKNLMQSLKEHQSNH